MHGSRLAVALGVLAAASLSCIHTARAQDTDRRVALVIGNDAYPQAPLRNAVNDARAMTAALRRAKFEVLYVENASKAGFTEAVGQFSDRILGANTSLFYYAGHALQVYGQNYLVPTDARIVSEQRVRLETMSVDAILDQMRAADTPINIVILDACRNNPFERRFRSVGGGLAQTNAPTGTLIAYATSPGKVAADGIGSNGYYAAALVTAMARPGFRIEDVFKQVRAEVIRATDGTQIPWESSSLIGDFVFTPAAAAAPDTALASKLAELEAERRRLDAERKELAALTAPPAAQPKHPADGYYRGMFVCPRYFNKRELRFPVHFELENGRAEKKISDNYGWESWIHVTIGANGKLSITGDGVGWANVVKMEGGVGGSQINGSGKWGDQPCEVYLSKN